MMKTRTRVLSIGPIPFRSFPLLTVSPLLSVDLSRDRRDHSSVRACTSIDLVRSHSMGRIFETRTRRGAETALVPIDRTRVRCK